MPANLYEKLHANPGKDPYRRWHAPTHDAAYRVDRVDVVAEGLVPVLLATPGQASIWLPLRLHRAQAPLLLSTEGFVFPQDIVVGAGHAVDFRIGDDVHLGRVIIHSIVLTIREVR